ncbi:sensor domain-containing diguanylate cyclase [Methylophaga sp. OBS1]|uniref:sensor domain-containing diguanylate cyclase n=1 Tax=Methylophaga sp. OBS1 TaxID=2991933 RepID=UPI00224FA8D7|nr:sensor domain-containing diguanylate cyclase [Methylophaga sp. OBS1]MCX4193715.1 sensor domain-containing diguanylate cyclase [Methylophaga sp. OBS1]
MRSNLPLFDPIAIEALLEIVSDGIWFWHADTGYVYRSPGWYKMLGYNPHSLENNVFTWERVIHPDDYPRVMHHFEQYISGGSDSYEIEYRCMTSSGRPLWIKDTGLIVNKDSDGNVLRMIGAHQDIDALKHLDELNTYEKQSLQNIIDARTHDLTRLNKELSEKAAEAERNASIDYLTSLSNRFSFEQRLESEIARAQRFSEPLSLIVMDLDKFKQINDQYGHPTGDSVLIRMGEILRSNLRQIDLASRWGGDEFALLLPNTPIAHALSVSEKLRNVIQMELVPEALEVSASFGVVELHRDESLIDFMRRADNALYESKNSGRNRVSQGH